MKEIEIFTEPLTEDERIVHTQEIQQMPARYHLLDILKNIKYGRPAENQKLIEKWIEELEVDPKKGVPFT